MFKRSAANYSLWPEQRRRRGRPLKFAAGSFVLGILCASAYGSLFSLTEPATGQGFSAQRAGAPVPIVIAREPRAGAAVPLPTPKSVDIARPSSRARVSTAKVALPLIGTPTPRPAVATDVPGEEGLADEVRLTGAEQAAEDELSLLGGDNEPPRPALRPGDSGPAGASAVSHTRAPEGVVPMPRPAPTSTSLAGKDSVPPAGSRSEKPAAEPKVTLAPAAKTTRSAAIEVRSKRPGVIVLTKRAEPAASAGDVETPTRSLSVRTNRAKASSAANESSARRGHAVVKKTRKPPVLARGGDAPARKVVRTSKRKKAATASLRKRRTASQRVVSRSKLKKTTRHAAKSRPKRSVATRQAARRRRDPLGPMIARATQALRAFAGSQGFGLGDF